MEEEERRRVIIIGLDGARLDVLMKWAKEGYLPTINRILNRGTYGTLMSVLPIHSFTAWTSLSTGVYPSKHGIYDVLLRSNSGYKRYPPNSKAVKVDRFWEILDSFGYKCCIINVPVTYPPKPLRHGVIVSSILTPSTNSVFAYPIEICELLRKSNYKILPRSKPGTEEYIEEVHEILSKQYDFVEWYMKHHDWDLIFWVIMSTEMLHHHYASFIDPSHPLYDPEYEEIVRTLYVEIDRYLANLIKLCNGDSSIFIVSDHGFAPYYGIIYLNAYLRKLGFLKTKHFLSALKRNLLLLAKRIGKKIYDYLPESIKRKAIEITGFGAYEFVLDMIDWEKTKAYVAFLDGHINVNLKGREKKGVVERKDYLNVIKEISATINRDDMLSKIDVITKTKYEVYFGGEYLEYMSDIFLLFGEGNEKPFKIRTDPFKENYIEDAHNLKHFDENIGYHTLYGIFLVYGSNIKHNYYRSARIVDIAPTILAIYGIKPPRYMDGEILKDIFVSMPVLSKDYEHYFYLKKRLKSITRKVIKKQVH